MKSIQTKFILLIFLTIFFTSIILGLSGIFTISEVLHESANDKMNLLCTSNAEKIDAILVNIEKSVNTLSHHTANTLESVEVLSDEELLSSYVNSIETSALTHSEHTDGVRSIYFRLAPELSNSTAGFYFVKREQSDEFSKVPTTDLSLFPENDFENVGWFYEPKKSGSAVWIEPYISDTIGQRIISYVVPLYKDGVFFGILGMDLSCEYIANVAKGISVFETGHASIFNNKGKIVYHRDYDYGSILGENDENFKGTLELLTTRKKSSALIPYTIFGVNKHLAFCSLRNGMRFCISAPDSEIYAEQNRLTVVIIVLTTFIIITASIITTIITRKMTAPIKKLSHVAEEMSKGNFDVTVESNFNDEIGILTKTFNSARDALKTRMEKLRDEAHHDGLTGVLNKTAFIERETELNSQIITGEAVFAVAVFDVNKLKIMNDVFGHTAGDTLLRAVSDCLASAFGRANVFRIGGDEFTVILSGRDAGKCEACMEKCINSMNALELEEYGQSRVSCASGFARFEKFRDKSVADVLRRADKEMYHNKAITKKEILPWQEGEKGIKQIQIDKYLEFLKTLSLSTEDYLYLYHMESDRCYLFGNIRERFNIGKKESDTVKLSELLAIVHQKDRDTLSSALSGVIDGDTDGHNVNCRLISLSNTPIWVNSRGKVINDEAGLPFVMVGRISENSMKHLYNSLTGLFNKNKFLADLSNEKNEDFKELMLLDIDGLADINIKYSSSYGNDLISGLAKHLEQNFPLNKIYHVEKDIFAILLDTDNKEEINVIFEEAQKSLEGRCTISASVVPNNKAIYVDNTNIYEYALQTLKDLKKKSFGKIGFFTEESLLEKLSEVNLATEMSESVKNGFEGFSLVFQPQFNADDFSLYAAETLLRYTSKTQGQIFPDTFIPILERTGLINEVGLFVLSSAIEQCKKWRTICPDFHIAVNFSVIQFKNENIADNVLNILAKNGLPGDALTVEITESVELIDVDLFTNVARVFKKAGIQIAIDDFGTGYSNLGYLKKIHADEVKIDRIFIRDIEEASYNFKLISNIIDFAKTNSLRVCIEGVETAEEISVISALFPDVLQGYIFDKPISLEEFNEKYFNPESKGYKDMIKFTEKLRESKKRLLSERAFNEKI